MDLKRLTRGPAIWVIAAVVILLIGARAFAPNPYKQIDTYQAIQLIQEKKVDSAKLIDRDQRIELTLSGDNQVDGSSRVQAYYVEQRGEELVTLLNTNRPPKGFDDDVPTSSWWSSLLITVLPLIIILGIFWFLMSQMQGGGSRV